MRYASLLVCGIALALGFMAAGDCAPSSGWQIDMVSEMFGPVKMTIVPHMTTFETKTMTLVFDDTDVSMYNTEAKTYTKMSIQDWISRRSQGSRHYRETPKKVATGEYGSLRCTAYESIYRRGYRQHNAGPSANDRGVSVMRYWITQDLPVSDAACKYVQWVASMPDIAGMPLKMVRTDPATRTDRTVLNTIGTKRANIEIASLWPRGTYRPVGSEAEVLMGSALEDDNLPTAGGGRQFRRSGAQGH
jgi:hypothetical protein